MKISQSYSLAVSTLILMTTPLIAQIERWDIIRDNNGWDSIIPGTEEIRLEPNIDLSGWNTDSRNCVRLS